MSANKTNNNSNMTTAAGNNSAEQVAQDIPADLRLLIRIVMRTFYGFELYLVMEMLMLYPCIKEEDLADLLRLDLKTVQQHLKNLKKEKFLSEKFLMETSQDGNKQCKQNYFNINYKMMVNVIKYKLDKIRQQIESEDKQFTTRAQFKCTQCSKTYTDLDTKDIFLTMTCVYCGAEIDEDASSMPTRSARNLIHTYNTQMALLFELLSKVEHIRLADHLLRPEPVDMTYILDRIRNLNQPANAKNAHDPKSNVNPMGGGGKSAMIKFEKWSGDKTRNTDLLSQTKISISFDSVDASGGPQRKAKELPSILLLNRTQDEEPAANKDADNRDSILLNQLTKLAADESMSSTSPVKNETASQQQQNAEQQKKLTSQMSVASQMSTLTTSSGGSSSATTSIANLEQNIMQLLLKHEKKSSNPADTTTTTTTTSLGPNITNNTTNVASLQSSSLINNGGTSTSSIVIRKRPMESQDGAGKNGFGYENENNNSYNFLKKRRLNNGDIHGEERHSSSYTTNGYNGHKTSSSSFKRNYSDGSDNSDEYYEDDDDEEDADETYGASYANNFSANGDEYTVPRVTVQNKSLPFDRITPKHISLMSEKEKEAYINICRQLYTEIYEI